MDCTPIFKKVLSASRSLLLLSEERVNSTLLKIADEVESNIPDILSANEKDLKKMDKSDPRFDRLLLSDERIRGIASDIRNVSALPSPLGIVLSNDIRPNGLIIRKVTVPFGVIGIVYESRPNVTIDVFSLCFKSGNACILKGGSDAINSNKAIVRIIKSVLDRDLNI